LTLRHELNDGGRFISGRKLVSPISVRAGAVRRPPGGWPEGARIERVLTRTLKRERFTIALDGPMVSRETPSLPFAIASRRLTPSTSRISRWRAHAGSRIVVAVRRERISEPCAEKFQRADVQSREEKFNSPAEVPRLDLLRSPSRFSIMRDEYLEQELQRAEYTERYQISAILLSLRFFLPSDAESHALIPRHPSADPRRTRGLELNDAARRG